MSRGITFFDKEEALEYKNVKEAEGYITYLIEKQGKYIVVLLGKEQATGKTKVRKLETPETELGYIAQYDPKEDIISFGTQASTTERVHEVGHMRLGHTVPWTTADARRAAENEIDAQIYAMVKMNRPIDYSVGSPALMVLSSAYKFPPKRATYLVKSILDSKEIELPREVEEYWLEGNTGKIPQ